MFFVIAVIPEGYSSCCSPIFLIREFSLSTRLMQPDSENFNPCCKMMSMQSARFGPKMVVDFFSKHKEKALKEGYGVKKLIGPRLPFRRSLIQTFFGTIRLCLVFLL